MTSIERTEQLALVRMWRNWNPCAPLVEIREERQTEVSPKIQHRITIWSSNSICSVHPEKWKAGSQRDVWRSVKFLSIAWVMPSSHLILCHPLLLPSVSPSIRQYYSALKQEILMVPHVSLTLLQGTLKKENMWLRVLFSAQSFYFS